MQETTTNNDTYKKTKQIAIHVKKQQQIKIHGGVLVNVLSSSVVDRRWCNGQRALLECGRSSLCVVVFLHVSLFVVVFLHVSLFVLFF
jgi:hypothetical protein